MNILVTGGNGLIGSALMDMLLKENHKVILFGRRFDTKYFTEEEKQKIEFVKGDLATFEHVLSAVEKSKPEVIYHIGAMLSVPSEADPQTSFHVNACGTYYVLEAARLFKVRQVIFSSSLSTYGLDIKGDLVDESTVQRPSTVYGIYKTFSENLGQYYRSKYDIDFRAARFAAIVGPGAKTKHIGVYNTWMIEKSYLGEPYKIFVTPDIVSSVTYFKDAAASLMQLAAAPKENIKTVCYNLPGHRVTAGELADLVTKLVPGVQLSFEPEEEIVNIFKSKGPKEYDCSKAIEEWNWKPSYSLEEMIIDFGVEMKKWM